MRKSILLSVLFVLLIAPVAYAAPTVTSKDVFWEIRAYDSDFIGMQSYYQSFMLASAVVHDDAAARTLYWLPDYPGGNTGGTIGGVYINRYSGQRNLGDPSLYWFSTNAGNVNSSPGADRTIWEKDYAFAVNFNDYPANNYTGTHTVAPGSLTNVLAIPTVSSPTPGTITWTNVGADAYRVTVYSLLEGLIQPDMNSIRFSSGMLSASTTTFTFSGPHPDFGVAIGIEAIDWADGNTNDFLRRSEIILYSPNPVPLPGAMILLGSGMLGLLGIRRKIRNI